MLNLSPLLFGLAVLCWPTTRCTGRLRHLTTARPKRRLRLPRPATFVVALGSGAAFTLLTGPIAGLAAVLATATIHRRWVARHTLRSTLASVDALTEALRSMVAELRAGAHPATAAESAAADARPPAANVMRSIAAAARLDGDIDRALATSRAATPTTATVLTQLSRAWTLAQRHGLPLAEVLDAVRADLEAKVRFARQVVARMAGPRASATILALLPTLGLALGEAMGAHPLHVLTTTPTGQLLLLTGTTLACAGLIWSARITNQVVLS
jgi:tight adherence protein B